MLLSVGRPHEGLAPKYDECMHKHRGIWRVMIVRAVLLEMP